MAHNLMGMLHQRLGEHHAAYRSFRAALRADRDYEPALENLSTPLRSLGPGFPKLDGLAPCRREANEPDPIGSVERMKFGPTGD